MTDIPECVYMKLFPPQKIALTTALDFQEVVQVLGLYIPVDILTGGNLISSLPF